MMKVSNIRQVLLFNLFIAIIGRSNAIKCAAKVTYTKEGEDEKTVYYDQEEEIVPCGSTASKCITASGSFKSETQPEYEVKSVQACDWGSICSDDNNLSLDAGKLALLINDIAYGTVSSNQVIPGSTKITGECCQTDECNKIETPTTTAATTTEAASGYLVNKMNFIFIVLISTFAVSASLFV